MDLKAARRKSGLTQLDCAHLLDVHPSRVSKLETGRRLPTVPEICTLSLIYGRSFESLFATVFGDARDKLRTQLETLPKSPSLWGRLNRTHTLNTISDRLDNSKQKENGAI